MPEYIIVVSGLDSDRVALWERHPDHPDGEVFIAGKGNHRVAKTAAVMAQLKRGVLVEIDHPRRRVKKEKPTDEV